MELILKEYNDLFQNNKLFRVYPELKSETDDYLKLLQSFQQKEEFYTCWFEIPIKTGFEKEEYVLKWNITAVEEYIKNQGIKSQNLKINHPSIWSCPSRLDKSKLQYFQTQTMTTKVEKPIILASHLSVWKHIIIDGNHRFHAAKNKNKENIKAIILPPTVHLEFMSKKSKTQFIIHCNLFVLENYINHPQRIWRQIQVGKDFDVKSFYPILDKKYIFSIFRKLKYMWVQPSVL